MLSYHQVCTEIPWKWYFHPHVAISSIRMINSAFFVHHRHSTQADVFHAVLFEFFSRLLFCFLHSKLEMNSGRHSVTQKKVQLISESLSRASPVRKPFELDAGALGGGVSKQLDLVPSLKNLRTPESIPKYQTQIGRYCMLAGHLWTFCAAFETISIGEASFRSTSNTTQWFLTR